MTLSLGKTFPNFTAKTTIGEIHFHDWLGDSWGILFSHPADFTPVCTTELARVLKLLPEFKRRNVKPIALSCDSVESHLRWINDIKFVADDTSEGFPYPIIEDSDRKLCVQLGMLDEDELDSIGIPLPARAVFIIDPTKKFRLSILYPATTGRNFTEILRTVDAMQMTDKNKVATPADWVVGEECMVLPTIPDDQVKEIFPNGITTVQLPSGLNYLRTTPQP